MRIESILMSDIFVVNVIQDWTYYFLDRTFGKINLINGEVDEYNERVSDRYHDSTLTCAAQLSP